MGGKGFGFRGDACLRGVSDFGGLVVSGFRAVGSGLAGKHTPESVSEALDPKPRTAWTRKSLNAPPSGPKESVRQQRCS